MEAVKDIVVMENILRQSSRCESIPSWNRLVSNSLSDKEYQEPTIRTLGTHNYHQTCF